MARVRHDPSPGPTEVDGGRAELLPDADRRGGWELSVDGVPQSYVDLVDPQHLEFGYVRVVGDLLDLSAPDADPLTVLHLGGGACTLARYVAATRPGSTQLVIEADARLAELVRTELGTAGFRLRVGDAREQVARLADASCDVVVGDVFAGPRLPAHVTTLEHVQGVRRVLRPSGTYALNIGDGGGLGFARRQVATLQEVFAHVALLSDPGVLRGRRFGNLVLLGSADPLPVAELTRRAARAALTARLVDGTALTDFRGGASPVRDADAVPTPVPPPEVFRR